jgi:hypothetical protein
MHRDGRRRREPESTTTTRDPGTSPTSTTTTVPFGLRPRVPVVLPNRPATTTTDNKQKEKDEAKFNNQLGCYAATKSSSLRRRRSVRIPGEESGTAYQVRVCIDRGDNEHEAVCAVSERSIGANLNDTEHVDVLSLKAGAYDLSPAFHKSSRAVRDSFACDLIVSAPSRLFPCT